jgi:hypothetical protein
MEVPLPGGAWVMGGMFSSHYSGDILCAAIFCTDLRLDPQAPG